MDSSQMRYAFLQWTSDKNKLSIEHMDIIAEPKKRVRMFLL